MTSTRTARRQSCITPVQLPAAGQRIGVECGPGEFARDNAGTVMALVTDRWGTHAMVMMDDGAVKVCESLNAGPGIGWHTIAPSESTHKVIDIKTGESVGEYKSIGAAHRAADKKDNAYGAYRYAVKPIKESK